MVLSIAGAVVAVSIKFPNEQFVEEMKDPNSDETLAFGRNLREKVCTKLLIICVTVNYHC